MSGSGGSRGDWPSESSTGQGGGSSSDPCLKTRRGPINSPQASVLAPMSVGSILGVDVQTGGPAPVLVVKDAAATLTGSLTFVGYLELITCIRSPTGRATVREKVSKGM